MPDYYVLYQEGQNQAIDIPPVFFEQLETLGLIKQVPASNRPGIFTDPLLANLICQLFAQRDKIIKKGKESTPLKNIAIGHFTTDDTKSITSLNPWHNAPIAVIEEGGMDTISGKIHDMLKDQSWETKWKTPFETIANNYINRPIGGSKAKRTTRAKNTKKKTLKK